MNKIDLKFKELKEKNEKALIPFIALGDKSLDETVEIAQVLEKAGADIVELGIPFSDPLADGPIIQDAYHRALTSGINIKDMIKTVENITSKINIPVIIMVYYNVVYCKGVEKFLNDLENAGVSGIIVPDVPLEEREELLKACENNNIDLIPLVAPTSKERINKSILKLYIFECAITIVYKTFLVMITLRKYPFPSRTRKSSSNVPTILASYLAWKIGYRQILYIPR